MIVFLSGLRESSAICRATGLLGQGGRQNDESEPFALRRMTMADMRLLAIIAEECDKVPSGFVDGKVVETRYGQGFSDALMRLHMEGCLDDRIPVGSISISQTGREALKRQRS
jgi:hypothetical protein